MRNKLLLSFALLICILLSFALVACGGDDNDGNINADGNNGENLTGITTQDLLAGENADYIITVKNDVTEYDLVKDFLPRITFNKGVTTVFSSKEDFSDKLGTTLSLNEGDNFIYLRVSDKNGNKSDYKFNIYRNRLLTVTFDPAGGSVVETVILIEENETLTPPTAVRAGYKFDKWSYDFKNPIKDNVTVVAKWIANEYIVTTDVDGKKTEYKVLFGSLPGIKNPYKLGYNFAGWTLNGSAFDTSVEYSRESNITIVANFEVVTYNIQYILGYEGAVNPSENPTSFNVNTEAFVLLDAYYDANHEFSGWYTDSSFSEDSKVTAITSDLLGSDVVLYAKWSSVSVVTLDPNGGECDTLTLSFGYNDEYVLPTPTMANYVFDGWYNGNERLNNTGVWTISGDVTLTAKWNPRQNSIEYVLGYADAINNENNPTSYDVEDGTVELLPPTFENGKVTFVGWYTDPNFTEESHITSINAENVTEEMILYAKWCTVSEVTFVTGNDTALDKLEISYGQEYELPVITLDNFTFAGWYDENDKLVSSTGKWSYEKDVTLTAKWVATEYQINYVVNGGSAVDSTYPTKYNVNTDFDSIVIPTPTKQYAEFGGWYFDKELTVPFNASELLNYDGVTLYAKWNAIKVTINYNADGGNVYQTTVEVDFGSDYTLLTAEKAGFDFLGWYDENGNLVDKDIKLTDPDKLVINLVAKWTLKKYKITYDLNGGTVSETLITEYDVQTEGFKLPTPTNGELYFVGWLMNDGNTSASVTIAKGSSGDLSFKAMWTSLKDDKSEGDRVATGLLFSIVDGKLIVVGIDREINSSITSGIKIPAYFNGIEVVGIDSYAFKAFGEKFSKTSYANMSSSYVTISVPSTVKFVGTKAFEGCNGIKVQLYNANEGETSIDYKMWDTLVTWESGNRSARDCIWGFRPAIGWTRYSKVTIPDGYDEVTD